MILGGGPAGCTAAIYASRFGIKAKIITLEVGGQLRLARKIENFPGFKSVSGFELASRLEEQVRSLGIEIEIDEVLELNDLENGYLVKGRRGEYEARALIIALGRKPRKLGVKGEKKLLGKGVSYCATCDMPFFKGKVVAIVGGGNSAIDAALYASELASKVYLIHGRSEFRAFPSDVERLKERENVTFLLNKVVKEIKGESKVESLILQDVATSETSEIACDGVFIEIGYETQRELFASFVKLNERGEIVIDEHCRCFKPESDEIKPGVFACGDVASTGLKQAIVACATGAIAAVSAARYLRG